MEGDALRGALVVGEGDQEFVGDALGLVGETGVFAEATDEFAFDCDAFVGTEREGKLFAGHDGFQLAGGDKGVVEERADSAGEKRELGGLRRVGTEEGNLEARCLGAA